MRVRVLFRWPPVRRPARVADAVGAVERMLAQNFFQVGELSGGAAKLKRGRGKRSAGRAANGDPG